MLSIIGHLEISPQVALVITTPIKKVVQAFLTLAKIPQVIVTVEDSSPSKLMLRSWKNPPVGLTLEKICLSMIKSWNKILTNKKAVHVFLTLEKIPQVVLTIEKKLSKHS